MCNPRKVMIHLARSIEQAWRRSVEQSASASGEVGELAQINADIRLDEEMGDMALRMLERVLSGEFEGFIPWDRDSLGHYRRNMGDVTMIYDPQTRRLRIESQLTELINAQTRAAADACGFTIGEVAVEAVGNYYEDGWGGRTKERAKQEASAKAEQKLQDAIEALHRQQNAAAFADAEQQAKTEAERMAHEELIRLQTQARAAMRERLQGILSEAEDQVYHVMNRAVGEAYRQSFLQLVKDNGGRIISDEKTGSVINMEMEFY